MTKFTEPTFDNDRLHGLLTYMDRLAKLEGAGYSCKREVAECIKAVRDELALSRDFVVHRKSGWNIIQAAKTEGATFDEMLTVHVGDSASIPGKVESLRELGYRFFHVYKGEGVIDDVMEAAQWL